MKGRLKGAQNLSEVTVPESELSLRIQVCPKKGISPTIPFWGWDLDHQSYSREGSGFLGYRKFSPLEIHELTKKVYPPGNEHIPYQGAFEDEFPFPQVGYVSSLEDISECSGDIVCIGFGINVGCFLSVFTSSI